MSKDSKTRIHKPLTVGKDVTAEVRKSQPNAINKWRQKLRGQAGSFGSPTRVLTTAILMFLSSQLVAALFISFAWIFTGHSANDFSIEKSTWWQFGYILLAEALAIWLVWQTIKRRQLKWPDIGLGRKPGWSDLKWAAGGFLVFYGLIIILSVIISALFPDVNLDQQQPVGFDNLYSPSQYIVALISLVVLPPLAEEIMVRGYLYSGLRKTLRFWPALLITSWLFGFAHLQPDAEGQLIWPLVVNTAILSAVLVYLREKTGLLYAAIAVHAMNNLVAFLIHFY